MENSSSEHRDASSRVGGNKTARKKGVFERRIRGREKLWTKDFMRKQCEKQFREQKYPNVCIFCFECVI